MRRPSLEATPVVAACMGFTVAQAWVPVLLGTAKGQQGDVVVELGVAAIVVDAFEQGLRKIGKNEWVRKLPQGARGEVEETRRAELFARG